MARQPFSLFEAVHLDLARGSSRRGFHVLWSPPRTMPARQVEEIRHGRRRTTWRGGARIPYESLFEEEEFPRSELTSPAELPVALRFVLEPEIPLDNFRLFEAEDSFLDQIAFSALVPTENSPLIKRALADLMVTAGTSTSLVLTGQNAALVIVGSSIGLVAVRSVSAVSGALWRGAAPEVENFGGDVARYVLNIVRLRLGIPPRDPVPLDSEET